MTPNDAEGLRPTADRGWPAACWRWLVEDWNWPAAGLDLVWGFLAVYLTLINAAVHLLAGIVRRESNAGLVTAVVLFLPFGGAAWWTLQRGTGLGAAEHMFFAAVVVLEHLLIVAWVVIRRGRVSMSAATATGESRASA